MVSSCFRTENVYCCISVFYLCAAILHTCYPLNLHTSDHWRLNASNPVFINLNVIPQLSLGNCISLTAFCVYLNNLTLALLPLGYLHRYLWRVGIFPVRTFYLFACLLWEKKCQMSVVITKDLQKCWVELELTFHP